jgi:RNA polymerase sigma-70 factor (ECF subfamily)
MSSMNDDKTLVAKARKGDRRAFEMIVMRYEQPLVSYFGRIIGDRQMALDFAQDVFLKVHASLDSFRPAFKFSTWLFKIASNHLIDHWRRRRIGTVSIDQPIADGEGCLTIQVPDPGPSTERTYELSEIRARIEAALDKIPPLLRELFVLRHVSEFSYEEIADIKGLPVGTVKNKVFQAKELVRGLLVEPS